MALSNTALPYGMRDVRVTPVDSVTGALGTATDLPMSQIMSFSEAEDFEELRGDDVIQAIRGKGPKVEWELDAGGLTIAAAAVVIGGTVTTSGTTPNQVRQLRKLGTDQRPYFKAEGQSISDSGGDFHTILYKCRASKGFEGSQEDGKFWVSKITGEAIPNVSNILYDFIQNETATAIP
jgi:hypothetical protein